VLLDEVDQDLQRRGHRFARYADDCNVYVRSQKAGERVLLSLRKLYEKLHLKVNEKKTEVGPVFGRKFLGYCLQRWSKDTVKIAVAPQALDTFKQRIRLITKRVGRKHDSDRRTNAGISAGVEGILPTRTNASDVQRSGLMDTAPSSCHPTQALADWEDCLQPPEKPRGYS
jgi:hypothetical protein